MKKCFLKSKKYLKKYLKINFCAKNKLKLNKKQLFFTKNNYLKTKKIIFLKNKTNSKGNFLVNLFK